MENSKALSVEHYDTLTRALINRVTSAPTQSRTFCYRVRSGFVSARTLFCRITTGLASARTLFCRITARLASARTFFCRITAGLAIVRTLFCRVTARLVNTSTLPCRLKYGIIGARKLLHVFKMTILRARCPQTITMFGICASLTLITILTILMSNSVFIAIGSDARIAATSPVAADVSPGHDTMPIDMFEYIYMPDYVLQLPASVSAYSEYTPAGDVPMDGVQDDAARDIKAQSREIGPSAKTSVDDINAQPATVSVNNYIWPVDGYITSHFGERETTIGSPNHKGIDIGGSSGQSIYASDGGYVIFSGEDNAYGLVVRIRHDNGDITLYSHCSRLLVKAEERVWQGQEIALMGDTGVSTGMHLHFELIIEGVNVDPLIYLP